MTTPPTVESVAAADATTAVPLSSGCGVDINYHAPNPVMQIVKLVPIFYGTWTDTEKTLVATFLSGLGGSSWMGINALYSDTTGYSSNAPGMYANQSVTFSNASSGTSLSDSQVRDLVKQGISDLTGAASGAGGDSDTIYLLLTGPDIDQVSSSTDAFCKTYCGWHTAYTQSNGVNVKYAWIGNSITQCPNSCTSRYNTPNDAGVDGMLSVMAHEITEAASDPLLTTWYDDNGYENADKCAWQWGAIHTTGSGKVYNVRDVNGGYYLLQMNYNPNTGTCVTGVPLV